ncbi:TetR/AcrR family transcriptional regulator [Pseudomonadales bacterium]|nr:TetR/AcrR family transcriptional regulator [Pseudomonadales bacterium]MDC1307269.1 TetR/AcrR family transcriptional regulator [Pseudomonadales bacterium]
MPRPLLTEAQRKETRKAIRAAAAKLYSENGLKDISARAVADAAGVSVGTIYSHFGSLAELMQSLWRQPVSGLISELIEKTAAITDPEERLRSLLTDYIGFSEDQNSVFRGAFLFVRPEAHEPPPQVALENDRFYGLFRNAILEGQRLGKFREGDADEFAQLVWSGVHGALALPVNFHRLALDKTRRPAEQMIDLLIGWLKN